MHFEFSTASKILFGSGKLNSIANIASEFGKNALIISGCPISLTDRLVALLVSQDISSTIIRINTEPTIDLVDLYIAKAREISPDIVIGLGGGSALDTAKTIAVFLTNNGSVTDYLEVIGAGKKLQFSSIPLLAVPTTAGTGSEVTRNAVLGSSKHQIKVSLRSPFLLPRVALIDPELTLGLDPLVSASTGLDALTQLIEPYTCKEPNPIVDTLCRDGIQRISRSIYKVYDNGDDLGAREEMCIGSLLSGFALANAKLGAIHGLAGALGGIIPAPHGVICARLLPFVMEQNIISLQNHEPDSQVLSRYSEISQLLCDNPNATYKEGIRWITNFCNYSKIPKLSTYGLSDNIFNDIIENANRSSSMKGNPIILLEAELRNILYKAL